MQHCSNEQIEKMWELLKLTGKKMKEITMAVSKEYGFTALQLSVVFILKDCKELTLSELSAKLGLSKSTVSSLVERMEKQGILIREIPEDNRRIVKLSLMQGFIEKHREIIDRRSVIGKDIFNFDNVSFEDAESIICGMEKIVETFVINKNDES